MHEDATFHQRFGGIARLYAEDGLARLRRARVLVIGIGGVGSWAAEALARSGVGHLTLVDLDEVCITNVNRQLHATDADIGRPKAVVMAERIGGINPECRVEAIEDFLTERNAEALLAPGRFDAVLDAIDHVRHKALIIARCRRAGIRTVTAGGAGGKRDPSRIAVADMGRVHGDKLIKLVRKKLRDEHGFPKGEKARFRVECVFSPECPVYPQPDGSVCGNRPDDADLRLNCASGYGTATFVTGAFGFVAAARIVERLATAPGGRPDAVAPDERSAPSPPPALTAPA